MNIQPITVHIGLKKANHVSFQLEDNLIDRASVRLMFQEKQGDTVVDLLPVYVDITGVDYVNWDNSNEAAKQIALAAFPDIMPA